MIVRRFTKYGIVAVGSAIVDWLVFSGLTLAVGAFYIHAQMISRITGGAFSFLTNKYWGFDSGNSNRMVLEGRRFLILFLASYCLSLFLIYIFAEIFEIPPFVAKLITDSIVFIFNFIIMQIYVFHLRTGLSALIPKKLRNFRPSA